MRIFNSIKRKTKNIKKEHAIELLLQKIKNGEYEYANGYMQAMHILGYLTKKEWALYDIAIRRHKEKEKEDER